jgi:hypothetical protein
LTNGDFETGPFTTVGTVTGWTVVGNVADIAEGATTPTHSAAFSAGANSQGDMILQSFFTNAGQTYTVDFDAAVAGTPTSTLKVEVQVDGNSNLLDAIVTPPAVGSGFQHYQFTFIADGSAATLKFTNIGLGNASADQVVDTVVVAPTSGPVALVNADFETGPNDTIGTVTGWTVGGSGKVAVTGEGATSGSSSAAFSVAAATQGDTLYQQFNTVPGGSYTVIFDAGIFGIHTGSALQVRVEVLGATNATLLDQTVTPPEAGTFVPALVQFQNFQFPFVADGATATLRFSNVGTGSGGADEVIDTVVVNLGP